MIFKSLMLCFATALLSGMTKDAGQFGISVAFGLISAISLGAALLSYLNSGGVLQTEEEKARDRRPCPCCGWSRRF